jgi:hypothetical protein
MQCCRNSRILRRMEAKRASDENYAGETRARFSIARRPMPLATSGSPRFNGAGSSQCPEHQSMFGPLPTLRR